MTPAAKPATVTELDTRANDAALDALHVAHDSLASALVHALTDLTVVELSNTANMGTFTVRYASLPEIVKKTRPVLARHGVVALTPLCSLDGQPAVSVVFVHEGGEQMTLGPFPFQHGRDAQATGSWVTYMRRYALVAALGMAAGDDDDGAAAEPAPSAAEQAAAEREAFEAAKEAAKDIVRELTGGDVELTKQAWKAIGGGKWDRESLTAAYEAWVEQPKDAPAEGGDS